MFNQIPYMMPVNSSLPATSTSTSLLGKINWSSLLSNAQKTLNVVNQAVPLYYQVKPIFKNIRTMGKIGKEFSKLGSNNQTVNTTTTIQKDSTPQDTYNNQTNLSDQDIPSPKFFL